MNPIMFYDTETTKLPLFSEPSSNPDQPHIVQCAAILVDADTQRTISSFDLTAKPDGWVIEPETTEIHGITNEHAARVGVPEQQIVSALLAFSQIATKRIGHVEHFDARILRIALKQFFSDEIADEWKTLTEPDCTARLARSIMGGKNPKLAAAYEFFTGKRLVNAHTAMADTMACAEVYWAIQDGNAKVATKPGEASAKKAAKPAAAKPAPSEDASDDVGFL